MSFILLCATSIRLPCVIFLCSLDFEVPVPVSRGSPVESRTSRYAGRCCRMCLDGSGSQMPAGWLPGIFPSLPALTELRWCSDYFSFSCDLCKILLKEKPFFRWGKKALYRVPCVLCYGVSCHKRGNICVSASCIRGGTTVKKA